MLPSCFLKAVSIAYDSSFSDSEPDLLAIQFFDDSEHLLKQLNSSNPNFSLIHSPDNPKRSSYFSALSLVCQELLEKCNLISVADIQCKTNWKDNSQILMAWDLIYRSSFLRNSGIMVKAGRDGVNISCFRDFRYCFVTVPTNRNDNFTTDSLSVKGVRHLSGGNYWGMKSQDQIADSIKELPNTCFGIPFVTNLYYSGYLIDSEHDNFRI